MRPYYEDGSVTIYHGDALNYLAEFDDESIDLIVADPPYGTRTNQRKEWMVGEFANVLPAALPEFYRVGTRNAGLYLFTSWKLMADWVFRCSPYFRMQNFLIWDKGRHSGTFGSYSWQFHWEGVFYGIKGPRPIINYQPDVLRTEERPAMPMQKPVDVMRKILTASAIGAMPVLDPFMGSGSTLVAAKQLGLTAIGIEIEERYCEIAAKRCAQETLGLTA